MKFVINVHYTIAGKDLFIPFLVETDDSLPSYIQCQKAGEEGRRLMEEHAAKIKAVKNVYYRTYELGKQSFALSTTKTTLEKFHEFESSGILEETPLEQLRFFCSLSLNPQDWLDSERFFDAIEKELEENKWQDINDVSKEIKDSEERILLKYPNGNIAIGRYCILNNKVGLGYYQRENTNYCNIGEQPIQFKYLF